MFKPIETAATPVAQLDERIRNYLQLTEEQSAMMWTSRDFVAGFPQMTRRLLSPEGLEHYPASTRQEIYDRSLRALIQLPWTGKVFKKPEEETLRFHIAAVDFQFFEDESVSSAGWNYSMPTKEPRSHDSLMRTDIACILLLGMSVEDTSEAMIHFNAIYSEMKETKQEDMKANLELLLLKGSPTRKWLLTHQLDIASGIDWDTTLVELLLNLPEHKIDAEAKSPKRLPKFLKHPDGAQQFTLDTFAVFLNYALQFAQELPMTTTRSRDLVDFMLVVKQLDEAFVQDPETQAILITLNAAIHGVNR